MFIASAVLHVIFQWTRRPTLLYAYMYITGRAINKGVVLAATVPIPYRLWLHGHALTAVLPMLSNCNMTQLLQVLKAHREWSLNWSMELTGYCNYVEKFDEFEMWPSPRKPVSSRSCRSALGTEIAIWVIFLSELFSLGLEFKVLWYFPWEMALSCCCLVVVFVFNWV